MLRGGGRLPGEFASFSSFQSKGLSFLFLFFTCAVAAASLGSGHSSGCRARRRAPRGAVTSSRRGKEEVAIGEKEEADSASPFFPLFFFSVGKPFERSVKRERERERERREGSTIQKLRPRVFSSLSRFLRFSLLPSPSSLSHARTENQAKTAEWINEFKIFYCHTRKPTKKKEIPESLSLFLPLSPFSLSFSLSTAAGTPSRAPPAP